jgi:hypothetical protein
MSLKLSEEILFDHMAILETRPGGWSELLRFLEEQQPPKGFGPYVPASVDGIVTIRALRGESAMPDSRFYMTRTLLQSSVVNYDGQQRRRLRVQNSADPSENPLLAHPQEVAESFRGNGVYATPIDVHPLIAGLETSLDFSLFRDEINARKQVRGYLANAMGVQPDWLESQYLFSTVATPVLPAELRDVNHHEFYWVGMDQLSQKVGKVAINSGSVLWGHMIGVSKPFSDHRR